MSRPPLSAHLCDKKKKVISCFLRGFIKIVCFTFTCREVINKPVTFYFVQNLLVIEHSFLLQIINNRNVCCVYIAYTFIGLENHRLCENLVF